MRAEAKRLDRLGKVVLAEIAGMHLLRLSCDGKL